MHGLRHSCSSVWLEQGVSIRTVAEFLGHADPGFTLQIYTHLLANGEESARQAFINSKKS